MHVIFARLAAMPLLKVLTYAKLAHQGSFPLLKVVSVDLPASLALLPCLQHLGAALAQSALPDDTQLLMVIYATSAPLVSQL